MTYHWPLLTLTPLGFVSALMVKMLLFKLKVLSRKKITIMKQVKKTTTTAMEKMQPKQELLVTNLRKVIINTVTSTLVSSKQHPPL